MASLDFPDHSKHIHSLMASQSSTVLELQKLAYKTLCTFFKEHENDVIEIEVLPPAIQPETGILMQEGLNIGIPKKILALAYSEARTQFFENFSNNERASTALEATKVMLLFDPEHLTAANYRKRRLFALQSGTLAEQDETYQKALREEICFLNSILTSPLHRQSKSPTLWFHRLWTLDLLMLTERYNSSDDRKEQFWKAEIVAVCKSGERHPKNYYAWQYARRIISRIDIPSIHDYFAQHVKDWCLKHPSDISGWSFLLILLCELHPISKRQNLVKEVLLYGINMQAKQESLWIFIRTILAQDILHEGYQELYQVLQHSKEELRSARQQALIVENITKTLDWIDTYRI